MDSSKDRWLLIVALAPLLSVAFGALLIVPQFQEAFRNFGAELPLPTRVLLATYRAWSLLAAIPLGLWLVWPDRRNRSSAAVIAGSLLAGSLGLFALYACYAPIFKLANTVG